MGVRAFRILLLSVAVTVCARDSFAVSDSCTLRLSAKTPSYLNIDLNHLNIVKNSEISQTALTELITIYQTLIDNLDARIQNNELSLAISFKKQEELLNYYSYRDDGTFNEFGIFRRLNSNGSLQRKKLALGLHVRLIRTVIDELSDPNRYDHEKLVSLWAAVHFARTNLLGFRVTQTKPETQSPTKEPPKSQKLRDKSTPPYITHSREYQPHTKDTEKEEGNENEEPYLVASINAKSAYVATDYYHFVRRGGANPLRVADLPGFVPTVQQVPHSEKFMEVDLSGADSNGTEVLPAFDGYMPVQTPGSNYTLRRNHDGSFSISSSASKIRIPVLPESSEFLGILAVEYLKAPIGIADHEWPAKIKMELLDYLKKDGDPLRNSLLVEKHIRDSYVYSIDKRDPTDPIEALKDGFFQCDLAALIMLGVVRDYLHLPARIVGGYRARMGQNENESVLWLPAVKHMWVQVYIGGRWYTFDPTPWRTSRKPKENKGKESPQQSLDRHRESSEEQQALTREELEKEIADISEHLKDKSRGSPGKRTQTNEINSTLPKRDVESLIRKLEIGSISLKDVQPNNPLLAQLMLTLFQYTVDPRISTFEMSERLGPFREMARRHESSRMKEYLSRAEALSLSPSNGLKDTVGSFLVEYQDKTATQAFKRILFIEEWLKLYYETQQNREVKRVLRNAMIKLQEIKSAFYKIAAPDFRQIGMVDDFYSKLPNHARAILAERTGLQKPGANSETLATYKELEGKSLNDLRTMSLLYEFTNFILETVPSEAFVRKNTLHEDTSKYKGRSLQIEEDYAYLFSPDTLLGSPHLSPQVNMDRGTFYRLITRKKVKVPSPSGISAPKRRTIVGYDTSQSMNGDPGEFQAYLIASFLDRALSDENEHLAVLLGWDDAVHTVHEVSSSNDVLHLIRTLHDSLKNTKKGTNLMAFFQQAFGAIAKAQRELNEPLANANIIVMTDGQAPIDIEQIKEWRSLINKETELKILFVAINDTNPQLEKLARDIKEQVGVDYSAYVEFDSATISKILSLGRNMVKPNNDKHYFSEHLFGEVKESLAPFFYDLENLISKALTIELTERPDQDFKLLMEKTKFTPSSLTLDEKADKDTSLRISQVRTAAHDILAYYRNDSGVGKLVANDLDLNLDKLLGRQLRDLGLIPLQHYLHLLHELSGNKPQP